MADGTSEWQYIPSSAIEAADRADRAEAWASKQRASAAQEWADAQRASIPNIPLAPPVRDDWATNPGQTPTSQTAYTVQPGDTLSGISERSLGDANAWPTVARANQLENPNVLQPGQRLNLSLPRAQLQTPPTGEDVRDLRSTGGSPYMVKPGDTLSDIARRMFGDPNRWTEIAAASGIADPNLIYPGQRLVIPPMVPRSPVSAPSASPSPMSDQLRDQWASEPWAAHTSTIPTLPQATDFGGTTPGGWEDIARRQLGKPYIWGSRGGRTDFSPDAAGFDCSGFVSYVMENGLGIKVPAQTASAYAATQPIRAEEARPGDVVLYNMGDNDPHIQHIAIYLGNGQVIQAGGSKQTRNVNIAPIATAGTYEFRRPVGSPNAAQTQTQIANVAQSAAPVEARSDTLEHSPLDSVGNWVQGATQTAQDANQQARENVPGVAGVEDTAGQAAQTVGDAAQGAVGYVGGLPFNKPGGPTVGEVLGGVGSALTEEQPWMRNVVGAQTKQMQAGAGISPYEPGAQDLTPAEEYAQARGIATGLTQTVVPEDLVARAVTTGAGSLGKSADVAARIAAEVVRPGADASKVIEAFGSQEKVVQAAADRVQKMPHCAIGTCAGYHASVWHGPAAGDDRRGTGPGQRS